MFFSGQLCLLASQTYLCNHTSQTASPKCLLPLLQAISVTPCLKLQQRDCTCQTSPRINMTCSIHCQSAKSKRIDMKPQSIGSHAGSATTVSSRADVTFLNMTHVSEHPRAASCIRKLPNQWTGCEISPVFNDTSDSACLSAGSVMTNCASVLHQMKQCSLCLDCISVWSLSAGD